MTSTRSLQLPDSEQLYQPFQAVPSLDALLAFLEKYPERGADLRARTRSTLEAYQDAKAVAHTTAAITAKAPEKQIIKTHVAKLSPATKRNKAAK
jgi:hypothetical protein